MAIDGLPGGNGASGSAREYLVFALGPDEYAIDILKVQEIRVYERPSALANAPAFVKGVVNLRGSIVPIVDLRIKFGAGAAEYTPFTVVVMLSVGRRLVGAVVDGVSDVVPLRAEDIVPAPEFAAGLGTRYIDGLAEAGERMLIVVDIEGLMLSAEMQLVDAAPRSGPDAALPAERTA
ncbi:MAG TPA: chemotaxis protein CheW [Rhodocyclaceae bacterium]